MSGGRQYEHAQLTYENRNNNNNPLKNGYTVVCVNGHIIQYILLHRIPHVYNTQVLL